MLRAARSALPVAPGAAGVARVIHARLGAAGHQGAAAVGHVSVTSAVLRAAVVRPLLQPAVHPVIFDAATVGNGFCPATVPGLGGGAEAGSVSSATSLRPRAPLLRTEALAGGVIERALGGHVPWYGHATVAVPKAPLLRTPGVPSMFFFFFFVGDAVRSSWGPFFSVVWVIGLACGQEMTVAPSDAAQYSLCEKKI